MSDDVILCIETMKESMQNAILHFEKEFDKIRAGKANVKMLDGVKVDYYGSITPLSQVASL
ncbi:MAG: ribosome recycling factor, partial [Bacteroidales bacterium]